MRFGKIKAYHIVVAALLVFFVLPVEPAHPKDNIFRRSVTAVRNFFKGDEEKTDSLKKTDSSDRDGKRKKDTEGRSPVNAEMELEQLYDNSLDENLKVPKLGGQKTKIREYQQMRAKRLKAAGEQVETMRSGEVIIATVACGDLFYPNDTVLKPTAGKHLSPYVEFLRERDMYRMMLAMHSDDTGSEKYTDSLTSSRVLAVLEWFQQHAAESDYVIPYAMGASEPRYENNSTENREKNRRLEIYLVPGRRMVKMASDSKLK